MKRLNGWQRLWIVLSVFYLLLVVAFTFVIWPIPETTSHREEFLTRMPSELRARVVAAYASRWEWEEARKKASDFERVFPDKSNTPKAKNLPPLTGDIEKDLRSGSIPSPPDFVPDPQPVTVPNGAILQIRGDAKKGDTEPDFRVADAYWAVVQSATRTARWEMARGMALVFLIPCFALYALGWAVAWVRRGFSRA
jgi:hypothetical protein